MSESKAWIAGCSGTVLTECEKAFLSDNPPWGFILFARNISEANQVSDLTAGLRELAGRADAPVFVDQEGGRVQRLRPPLAPNYPPGRALGALHAADRQAGRRAAWVMSRLHAFDLLRLGINADCLPVLDVPVKGAHDVIGDRAYSNDPQAVADIGRAAADGLVAGGVLPVIKHMPGHGRGCADSHKELPRVSATLDELRGHDFVPFKALSDEAMAMTAHIVFDAVDPTAPSTTSAKVISEIIRGEIGFDGLLMSDDVSMQALSGDFESRAAAILAAGCDVVLHCNGNIDEMRAVASHVPDLAGKSLERAKRALKRTDGPDDANEALLRAEFAGYFEAAA